MAFPIIDTIEIKERLANKLLKETFGSDTSEDHREACFF